MEQDHTPVRFAKALPRRAKLLWAIFVFGATWFVYNANCRVIGAPDTVPNRFIPISLMREGDFDFDEFRDLQSAPYLRGLALYQLNDHWVSRYAVMPGVLALPVYACLNVIRPLGNPPSPHRAQIFGKVASTACVAAAAALLFLVFCQFNGGTGWALTFSFVYAFGTCAWIISQDIWQHPAGMLGFAGAVYCLIRGERQPHWLQLSAFPLSIAVASRPPNLVIALIITAYVAYRMRRQFWKFCLVASPVAIFLLSYNWCYLGSPWSIGYQTRDVAWNSPFLRSFLGLLVSPNRGLLVYSPVFIFAVVGAVTAFRKRWILGITLALALVANLALYSKWWAWYGGYCYGYRMLTDSLPFLMLLAYRPIRRLWRRGSLFPRLAISAMIVWGVAVQLVGVLSEDGGWDRRYAKLDDRKAKWTWRWSPQQTLYYLTRGLYYLPPPFSRSSGLGAGARLYPWFYPELRGVPLRAFTSTLDQPFDTPDFYPPEPSFEQAFIRWSKKRQTAIKLPVALEAGHHWLAVRAESILANRVPNHTLSVRVAGEAPMALPAIAERPHWIPFHLGQATESITIVFESTMWRPADLLGSNDPRALGSAISYVAVYDGQHAPTKGTIVNRGNETQ